MGFLQRMSSVAAPARMHASAGNPADPFYGLYGGYLPPEWYGALSAAGVSVTPDNAMALSALYSGVTMIAYDLATCPAQTFRMRDDEGKDRVRGGPTSPGIGGVAYRMRWAPNDVQTSVEWVVSMVAQFLLRGRAYAEIVGGPTTGIAEQYLPRHPDRVRPERLPSGRMRYKLIEASGAPRYVTQEEMLVVRDLSFDGGMTSTSRIQYGAQALGSALASQQAQAKFFKSGMTAATVATYTGDLEPEDEAALHASISRYAAGTENSFGLMLIPDDVKISSLSPDPQKAMMIESQEEGVRNVARLLHLPGSKLGLKDSVAYASAVQAALDYIVSCLRPIAVTFEQAFKRDLIIQKELYEVVFKLEAMMRGDFTAQSEYLEKFIRSRVMRPSEARLILEMNPDPALDKLSEGDMRPGTSSTANNTPPRQNDQSARAHLKGTLALHDTAMRVLRREKHDVEALAKKHASDVDGWQAGLREFYADHAGFVAREMRLDMDTAMAYAAQHGSQLEQRGIVLFDDGFERAEADELCALALSEDRAAT
jgi:HK97 family phage portal protein